MGTLEHRRKKGTLKNKSLSNMERDRSTFEGCVVGYSDRIGAAVGSGKECNSAALLLPASAGANRSPSLMLGPQNQGMQVMRSTKFAVLLTMLRMQTMRPIGTSASSSETPIGMTCLTCPQSGSAGVVKNPRIKKITLQ